MASNLFKRVLVKSKRTCSSIFGTAIVIKPAKWIKKQSHKYEEMVKMESDINIVSNIDVRNSYPQSSMAIECAIDDLLKSGEYTKKNILVIKNPYQYSPLCALAVFQTKKPYGVKVTVKGKTSECDIAYQIPETTEHRVPIMGLYADYKNTIIIELLNEKGKTTKKTMFQMDVAPLKGRSSTIKVTKELSETEYLYNLTLVYGGDDGIFPYAFDRNGDIRFCFSMSPKTYGFQPISKGRFLFLNKKVTRLTATNPTSTQLFEVDQMGRFHKTYNVEKGAHHDFAETGKGNFVMGSNCISGKTFEDTVIEIDRKTGNVLKEIAIKDYIDPKYVDSADWAHLNTLEFNEEECTVMVCLRNLHSVIKINYEKKELLWILGNPLFWEGSTVEEKVLKPEGDIQWFFQSHAAYTIDTDLDNNPDTEHIIIYDNHTQARRPVDFYDNKKKSFVKIYTIDKKLKTVKMLKSYPCKRSHIRSNCVFEAEAGRVMAMSGKFQTALTGRKGSVIEFDYETGKELNRYATNYGFYRAYEFKLDVNEMSKRMEIDRNYALGKAYDLIPCETIEISEAKELPEPILEEVDKTEEDRKERLNQLVKKNPDYYVDPEQDMARIVFEIEDDILYVTLIDHLLQGIYFVGKNHTYLRDFSATKQERPEYFARANNTDPIPLNNLAEDEYEIYFKHSIGLYKSQCYVKIRKNEDK